MNTVATLEDLGHTVFEAYSAKEALEILRREDSVDLIVADHAMPKMTGTELAKVVRSEWPDIPVLLATGYADRVPGDDIGLPKLTKPFMERDLRAAIERMNPPRRKPERVVSLRPRNQLVIFSIRPEGLSASRSSLITVSALLPTLATAASISSADLFRRLRHCRAESVVDISTRLRDGLGLDDVIMTERLRGIKEDKPPTNLRSS